MKRIIHLFLLFFCLKSFAQQELIVPLPAMIVEDYDFCKSWLVSVHSKKDSITVPLNSSLFHEQLKNQSVLALRTQFFSNNYIITLFLIGDAYGYELLNYKRTKFKKCRKRSKFKVFFKSLDRFLENSLFAQNARYWFFDECESIYSQQNTIFWNSVNFDGFENAITIEQKGVLDTLHEDDEIRMVLNCYDYLILWLEITHQRREERDGEVGILLPGWKIGKVIQEGDSLTLQKLFDSQLLEQIIEDQNDYELTKLSNVLKHPTENKLLFEFLGDDDYLYVVYDLDVEHVLRSWFSECLFAWQKKLASQARCIPFFAGNAYSKKERESLAEKCCGVLVDLTPGQVDLEDNT